VLSVDVAILTGKPKYLEKTLL